jgi:rhomboid family GlyGly-CTERM serine protease
MHRHLAARSPHLGPPPAAYVAALLFAFLIQLVPAWQPALLYSRSAIADGHYWRLWTGHFVHFGWPHFIADAGLLLLLGCTLGRERPRAAWPALTALPVLISLVLFWADPQLDRYAGLSALNLGLLLYFALHGWDRGQRDWFWPGIIGLYAVELGFEAVRGGHGGGFIAFSDPSVRVATGAHLIAAGWAFVAWLATRGRSTKKI